MEVVPLTVEEVLPIRHRVLWPDKPISFCRVPEDDNGKHYGVKFDCSVVCVASVFILNGKARLRKFATMEEFQGRGIGSFVLRYIVEECQKLGVKVFWFDAREEAIPFYSKFGFTTEGDKFYKTGIPYFKMVKSLV